MSGEQRERTLPTTGRPPLTERRKAETRLEVARIAVHLFLAKGVAHTSAEEIAAAAGISTRTLWRYFPTKESCIRPLLTDAIEITARYLRIWHSVQGVAELFEMMQPHIHNVADQATLLRLVRLTAIEPGLRAVWLQAHRDAEPMFAEALAHRVGMPGPNLTVTVQAAMLNTALRVAVEQYAANADQPDAGPQAYEDAIREALEIATRCLSF